MQYTLVPQHLEKYCHITNY